MTTDKKAICEFVKQWMDSHEPDTFIKNKSGQCIYTAGATSLNLTLYFEELLGDYISEHSTKEQEEILSTLKEAEEQLRWLYNNAEFEGGMPVRSCIDRVNEIIKKYSTPVKK